jgi:DNA replicative helicase MCM subunit Mcm2 (Cdc46/Mcm family)
MTIDKRFSGTLDDISEVVLRCKRCGARMGYDPKNWKTVPFKCENCPEPVGMMLANSLEYQYIERLKAALQKAIEAADALPFEIRLEFICEEENGEGK